MADNLTTFMCRLSWNLAAWTSWNPQGLSRPVMGLPYLNVRKRCVMREWLVVISLTAMLYKNTTLTLHVDVSTVSVAAQPTVTTSVFLPPSATECTLCTRPDLAVSYIRKYFIIFIQGIPLCCDLIIKLYSKIYSNTTLLILRIYTDIFRLLEAVVRLNMQKRERERERESESESESESECECVCVYIYIYIYIYTHTYIFYNPVKWTLPFEFLWDKCFTMVLWFMTENHYQTINIDPTNTFQTHIRKAIDHKKLFYKNSNGKFNFKVLSYIYIYIYIYIYRVSQEKCEILQESVPYVKLYR